MPITYSPGFAGVSLPSPAPLTGLVSQPRGYSSTSRDGRKQSQDVSDPEFENVLYGDYMTLAGMSASLKATKAQMANELYSEAKSSGNYEEYLTSGEGLEKLRQGQLAIMQKEAEMNAFYNTAQRYKEQLGETTGQLLGKKEGQRGLDINTAMHEMDGTPMYFKDAQGEFINPDGSRVLPNDDGVIKPVRVTLGDMINQYESQSHFDFQSGGPREPQSIIVEDVDYFNDVLNETLNEAKIDEIEPYIPVNAAGMVTTPSGYTNKGNISAAYSQFLQKIQTDPVLLKTYNVMMRNYKNQYINQNKARIKEENITEDTLAQEAENNFHQLNQRHQLQEILAAPEETDPVDRNLVDLLINEQGVVPGQKRTVFDLGARIMDFNIFAPEDMSVEDYERIGGYAQMFTQFLGDEQRQPGMLNETYFKSLMEENGIPEEEFESMYGMAQSVFGRFTDDKRKISSVYHPETRKSLISHMNKNYGKLFALRYASAQTPEALYPDIGFNVKDGQPMVYQPKNGRVTWDPFKGKYIGYDGTEHDYKDIVPGAEFEVDTASGGYTTREGTFIPRVEGKTNTLIPDVNDGDWVPLSEANIAGTIDTLTLPTWEYNVTDPKVRNNLGIIGQSLEDFGNRAMVGGHEIDMTSLLTAGEDGSIQTAIVDVDKIYSGLPFSDQYAPAVAVKVAFREDDFDKLKELLNIPYYEPGEDGLEQKVREFDSLKDLQSQLGWTVMKQGDAFAHYKLAVEDRPLGFMKDKDEDADTKVIVARFILPWENYKETSLKDIKDLMLSGDQIQLQQQREAQRSRSNVAVN